MGIIEDAVGIANSVTLGLSLQATVQFSRCLTKDGYGKREYADPVPLTAVVDMRQVRVATGDGTMDSARATVLFIDKLALMAATANAGIGLYDKIVLPDGTTGPIMARSGFTGPASAVPVYTEVAIG